MRRPVAISTAVAGALALALGLSACSPAVQWRDGQTPDASAGTVTWKNCRDEARKLNPRLPRSLRIDCGTVTVPQDWSTAKDGKATDGKTFDIALMRFRSTDQHDRIGSIVTNPGGPGGSGVDFAAYFAGEIPDLLSRFDLIGFDPRGVNRSAAVECISDSDLDASFGYEPDPATDPQYQGLVSLARHIGEGCGSEYGESLRLFSTKQAARDIEAIRVALGDTKLTYLGFSYGTLLGAVYAELYPTAIRAMVLDGAVDPQVSPVASSEGQAMGFERAFANFVTWCKAHPGPCPISADPRAAVIAAINRGRSNPVVGRGGRQATAGWVFYAIVSSMYSEEAWPYLGQAINGLADNDPELAFLLADNYAERDPQGHYSNLFDANTAVNCADSDQYPTVEATRALQDQWRTKYPLFGAPLAVSMLNCTLWPGKKDPYPVGPATGAPPIVVVGTKGDPATPYESTAKLANMLGTGTVLTWEGEGHTAYPSTQCIRKAVDDYLIDLKVPAKDLTCPA